jgi:hypothetical protein
LAFAAFALAAFAFAAFAFAAFALAAFAFAALACAELVVTGVELDWLGAEDEDGVGELTGAGV